MQHNNVNLEMMIYMKEEIIFIQIDNKQYAHLNDSIHICENMIQYLYI